MVLFIKKIVLTTFIAILISVLMMGCQNIAGGGTYVDLGLPSGTLWKSVNEKGYYEYNEAYSKYGGSMPSKEQWQELKKYCKWEWDTDGYNVIGPNENSIFLPAMGSYLQGEPLFRKGTYGYYWSSTPHDEQCLAAYYMHFSGPIIGININDCKYYQSVRLVK